MTMDASGAKVLIVDDDAASRRLLEVRLRALECKVEMASDGEEGLLLVKARDFDRLMERVHFVVGRMCDDILDGRIPVRPYRQGKTMPCTYCDYRSVCRFEFPEADVRYIDSLKKEEIWKLLKTDVRI